MSSSFLVESKTKTDKKRRRNKKELKDCDKCSPRNGKFTTCFSSKSLVEMFTKYQTVGWGEGSDDEN